jgi:hypothetical protein
MMRFSSEVLAMSDYPRFQIVEHHIDNAHRHYHGGGVVTLFLSLVDHWIAWRGRRKLARTAGRPDQPSKPEKTTSAAAT